MKNIIINEKINNEAPMFTFQKKLLSRAQFLLISRKLFPDITFLSSSMSEDSKGIDLVIIGR